MKLQKLTILFVLILASCTEALTPTPLPTKFSTPTSTLAPMATMAATPSAIIYPTQVYGLLLSPDGKRRVQSLDWNTYEILGSDGIVLWSFSYDNKFEVPEPGWHPFHWSLDGKHIFFTCYHGPDDSSTKFWGNYFADGDCVFRFDVDTGELTEIIPDMHPGYYAFSISPDDAQLVYANQTETPVKIRLLDLNTNKERVIFIADEKILEMGNFRWSSKMDKLLFSALGEKGIHSILVLDLKNLNAQTIIDNFDQWLGIESWDEQQGYVYYRDQYRAVWQLNLENRTLIPLAVPTLTPSP